MNPDNLMSMDQQRKEDFIYQSVIKALEIINDRSDNYTYGYNRDRIYGIDKNNFINNLVKISSIFKIEISYDIIKIHYYEGEIKNTLSLNKTGFNYGNPEPQKDMKAG